MSNDLGMQDGLSSPPTLSLDLLPEDVLLRIIALSGDLAVQIGVAYRLGAVCVRLRRFITSQFLASITKITPESLLSLSLSDSSAARAAFVSIFSVTSSLRELHLPGCSPTLLSRTAMTVLSKTACDTLVRVNLAYCRVSDDVLQPLLRCRSLRFLVLISCDGPTGRIFSSESCIAPLETLDLSWVSTVDREGIAAIATLPTLRNLVLRGCEAISNSTLRYLFRSNIRESLESITLAYCPIRDCALLELVKCMPRLRSLVLAEHTSNLWSTGEFTQAGIKNLRELYPNVNIRFLT